MSGPRILIGIVTRNRAEILPKAIASALAQQGPALRMAVIDDASTDATSELVGQFPQVEWVRWPEGRGYLAARNHWLSDVRTDYFVSLDDDAWFLQGDEIAVAVEHLERNRSVAAVAFDILSPDRPTAVARKGAKPVAMFIGCGHVLRLSAVREVGFYEPAPGSYGGEEKDLCLRLLDAGYQTVRLPGIHVWHDKTAVARVFPEQYRSLVCNDLVMALWRTPLSILPVALLAKLYRHGVFSWRHNLLRPCLGGCGLFFKSMPEVWRTRKPVRIATLRAYMRLSRS